MGRKTRQYENFPELRSRIIAPLLSYTREIITQSFGSFPKHNKDGLIVSIDAFTPDKKLICAIYNTLISIQMILNNLSTETLVEKASVLAYTTKLLKQKQEHSDVKRVLKYLNIIADTKDWTDDSWLPNTKFFKEKKIYDFFLRISSELKQHIPEPEVDENIEGKNPLDVFFKTSRDASSITQVVSSLADGYALVGGQAYVSSMCRHKHQQLEIELDAIRWKHNKQQLEGSQDEIEILGYITRIMLCDTSSYLSPEEIKNAQEFLARYEEGFVLFKRLKDNLLQVIRYYLIKISKTNENFTDEEIIENSQINIDTIKSAKNTGNRKALYEQTIKYYSLLQKIYPRQNITYEKLYENRIALGKGIIDFTRWKETTEKEYQLILDQLNSEECTKNRHPSEIIGRISRYIKKLVAYKSSNDFEQAVQVVQRDKIKGLNQTLAKLFHLIHKNYSNDAAKILNTENILDQLNDFEQFLIMHIAMQEFDTNFQKISNTHNKLLENMSADACPDYGSV